MTDNILVTRNKETMAVQSFLPAYLSLYNSNPVSGSIDVNSPYQITYSTEGPSQGTLFSPASSAPYTGISVNSAPSTIYVSYSLVLGFTFNLPSFPTPSGPAIVQVRATLFFNGNEIDSAFSETSVVTTYTSQNTYLMSLGNSIIYTANEVGVFTVEYVLTDMNTYVSEAFINGATINVKQLH